MIEFLLDTNVPSEVVHTRPDPRILAWLQAHPRSVCCVSVITVGEVRRGIQLLPNSHCRARLEAWLEVELVPDFEGRSLPVTRSIADRWRRIQAARQQIGAPVGPADGLIAATAIEHNLTLVTRNIPDFANLPLTLLNPWN